MGLQSPGSRGPGSLLAAATTQTLTFLSLCRRGRQRATPQQREAEAGCPELHAALLALRNLCYPQAGLGAPLLLACPLARLSSCLPACPPVTDNFFPSCPKILMEVG